MAADDLLRAYPVTLELPVAWGDMDAFGHVNNTVYFRYFESARIAYLVAIGLRGDEGAVGPILASTHCRFRLALDYPDTIAVGARATEVQADRFTMEYRVVSRRLGKVAADGGGVVVGYDYANRRKAELPAAVVTRIRELEASTGE